MERKRSRVTPENYTRAIISLSRRCSSTSVFPGNNYIDMGDWMLLDRNLLNLPKREEQAIPFASDAGQTHDLVVVYNSSEGKWDVQGYSQEEHGDFYAATSAPEAGLGQLIFIRGFISPSWVSTIGSKYNIDPEFFRRHMEYLSASVDRHAYSLPSLASSSNNIFRLCTTVGPVKDLTTWHEESLLIQDLVVVWMDHGRPLEKSPPGPWTSHIESKATALPIIQHHHKMAFRTTTNYLDPNTNSSVEFQQSTAVLPLQYDSLVGLVDLSRRAAQDPLSMCIPLFAHAAFSEIQFLNLMESRIRMQIDAVAKGVSADALGTFQYFCNILDRHARQLAESTRAFCKLINQSNQRSNGVRAASPMSKIAVPPSIGMHREMSETETARNIGSSNFENAFAANNLWEDYEQLHIRCIDLSRMCTQGINLAMNKATIEESRKAIEQSERLKKLTLLATFFIPLTFSTSLFGMNIDLLGQNGVRFWWFFVLCVPITLSAYVLYLWDFQFLKRCWERFWKDRRCVRRNKTAEKSNKDPSHIV
ncbi:conserved hypothetical protein [Pyrenophora tritici-repentis Pt-1C-BFP]|uniref:CorA, Mg2+ and Co2+ transporter n=1 Tax=Pyrenophora tritici-repentis (strain Pt-1C-BFP) TaxID=426418 RepID=B2W8B3_PYRTR|nr:uncharacterized protein PTRG_06221 [Pyrenophora tritici-repentis Pt-1C-BFP]EDU49141.1 conserved hypothetical protein [Pyrenophora tritici-repentis Pt-1C-BFP]